MTAAETDAEALLAEARGHHRAGRLLEAERLYKRLSAGRPRDAILLSRLGAALAGQGKLVEALAALERALEIDGNLVNAHNNIAIVHRLHGRADDAADAFRRALAIDPAHASAQLNLGALLTDMGQLDEAAACYRAALDHDPNLAEGHNGLGATLMEQGAVDEAEAEFGRALALDPGHGEALSNLGMVKRRRGDIAGAVDCYRRAIAARPRLAAAHINLGNALRGQGALDEAAAALRAAIDIDRANPEAHWNLGQVLLLTGDFAAGWQEYEWRAKCRMARGLRWDFGNPRWDGARARRKHLLLFTEQGFGDAIQFVRFAAAAAERVRHVVVRCPAPLARLFETAPGVAAAGPDIETTTNVHLEAPMMSLPAILDTAAAIPASVPYLKPPTGAAPALDGAANGALKVGLVWAGNPGKTTATVYSLPFDRLAPVLEVPDCAFFALQVGPGSEQMADAVAAGRLVDLGRGFADFGDTAAAIAALDLVITIDTAVAHLAGALGRPTWTLLAHVPDWRWLMDRDDSPWYPTMRLFRQPKPGDWDAVVADVVRALGEQARGRA